MLIKNYQELASSKARKEVLNIIEAGINAVEPRHMLSSVISYNKDFNSVKIFNKAYDVLRGRIFIVGGGKAGGAMAEALEKIIGSKNITAGCVSCLDTSYQTKKIKLFRANHPLPGRRSVRVARRILKFKEQYVIGEKDLVICLISGGASALLSIPAGKISIRDVQKTTKLLLESGANIVETNIVRKHISKIKGGRMAQFFYPAQLVSLFISDVIGNKLEVIGSGLSVPDPSTYKDAMLVLRKYRLSERVPRSIKIHIESGASGEIAETPKQLNNVDNYIVGDNQRALEAMAHRAVSAGFSPVIIDSAISGEPNAVALKIARQISIGKYKKYNVILLAGETNPKLPKKYGRGGRNQQFVAASMLALDNHEDAWTMASISSDGIDYDLEVAGAVVDEKSLALAKSKNLAAWQYVKNFDTYSLFKKMGHSLLRTGLTGTNVADLAVYILNNKIIK